MSVLWQERQISVPCMSSSYKRIPDNDVQYSKSYTICCWCTPARTLTGNDAEDRPHNLHKYYGRGMWKYLLFLLRGEGLPSCTRSVAKLQRRCKMKDPRGVKRGRCTKCLNCTEYEVEEGAVKCANCKCPPGLHENLTVATATQGSAGISQMSTQSALATSVKSLTLHAPTLCSVQGCTRGVDFDPNTGVQQLFCSDHLGVTQSTGEPETSQVTCYNTFFSHWVRNLIRFL